MTTQELMNYYDKNFRNVLGSYGLVEFKSDKTVYAFFLAQAARFGMDEKKIHAWAKKKADELLEESIYLAD